jgi:hypothetical protein
MSRPGRPRNRPITLAGLDVVPVEIQHPRIPTMKFFGWRRRDYLAEEFARGWINDRQYNAGVRWAALWETSQGAPSRVDLGQQYQDPNCKRYAGATASTYEAQLALREISDRFTSAFQHELLCDVLGQAKTVREAASCRGMNTNKGSNDLKQLGQLLRETLTTLADYWNL